MNHMSRPPVESADRALVLVLALQARRVLSVREAAIELDVSDSTAHRLLNTLVGRGFAKQERFRRYAAGPALRRSLVPSLSCERLTEIARPALEYLVDHTSETAHLAVRHGTEVTFLAGLESTSMALRVGLRIGVRMPAYCTASGRALLAELPNEEVEAIHRGVLPSWPAARMHTMAALKRRLGAIRHDGYAASFQETETGVVSFGVAVTDTDRAVCALAVALPRVRYQRPHSPRYVGALMEAAHLLQERMEDARLDR